MDRTERFYKIKELLRRHQVASFATLQAALEVSRSTLKRDLNYLSTRLNNPIAYRRELGGYRLEKTDDASSRPHGLLMCCGHTGLSAPLMHRLAESGVAQLLLEAQFQRATSPAFPLDMTSPCVAGKIKNTHQVLQRGARKAKVEDEAKALTRLVDDLAAA